MSSLSILRRNVCTVFNLLNALIALCLFLSGAYSNLLFLSIVVLNTVIATVSELRARKTVARLSLLNRPSCFLWDGQNAASTPPESIREGDLLLLTSGMQLAFDVSLEQGSRLTADESVISGESEGVFRKDGDTLLAGTFILSGRGFGRVLHDPGENYTERLSRELCAVPEKHSGLIAAMNRVTHFTAFLIVPIGLLLFLEAVLFRGNRFDTAVLASAAALLGMLPKGLVLLISVSLSLGVLRLSKKSVLVRNLYALETLSHADTLCLDKTGTLTDGQLHLKQILPLWAADSLCSSEEAKAFLSLFLQESPDQNATVTALRAVCSGQTSENTATAYTVSTVPFSSERKWSAVSLSCGRSLILGAPERLLTRLPDALSDGLTRGFRVVVFGISDAPVSEETLPSAIHPLYAFFLEDRIRAHAPETLSWFRGQGVSVKIISGDHIRTAALAARNAGLADWNNAIDLSAYGENADYRLLCEQYAVFARVTPAQKQQLIRALRENGHRVAMTGDGINDLLALREADCSIALGDGSDASRQVAQIVLLHSDFTVIPDIVSEGQRALNHVTRTSGVFFIKTIYSVLVSVFCLLCNLPFPFIPLQITLIDACVEALPAFLTIREAHTEKPADDFLHAAVSHALPFALLISLSLSVTALFSPFSPAETRTVSYLLLAFFSMAAVIRNALPLTPLRALSCLLMAGGFALSVLLFPARLMLSPVSAGMLIYLLGWLFLALIFKKLLRRIALSHTPFPLPSLRL